MRLLDFDPLDVYTYKLLDNFQHVGILQFGRKLQRVCLVKFLGILVSDYPDDGYRPGNLAYVAGLEGHKPPTLACEVFWLGRLAQRGF